MAQEHAPESHAAHPHALHPEEKPHPTWSTYWKVAIILTVITIVEVSAYYIPAWSTARIYAPSMLLLSGLKFAIVAMFYMHLKYDHRLFRALFTGPLLIAMTTIVALLFLFGQIAIRLAGQG
jgi:cytochrome c oxidase subunit 4